MKPENLGQARTLLTSMSKPKQGKTNMNHNAQPAGTLDSLRENQKNNVTVSNCTTLEISLVFFSTIAI